MSRAGALRLFWIGAVATLVVAALLALAAVLGGSFDGTDWKILGSLGTLLLGGAVATVGVSLREANRSAGLGRRSQPAGRCLRCSGSSRWPRASSRRSWARQPFLVVLATAALATGLAVIAVATESGRDWKALVATLIVMALAYVLVPVWRRLAGTGTDPTVEAVGLAQGVEVSRVNVRLALAGASTVADGQCVLAPGGTTLELTGDGRAILIGR